MPASAAAPTAISSSELLRLRLLSQGLGTNGVVLADGKAATGSAVVERLFALQGQDLPGALWSIGLRAPGSTIADVRALFDRGEIVRTWPFRGTLFAIAAVDAPWVMELTSERIFRSAAKRREGLGLDETSFDAARAVAQDALSGGRGLKRKALLDAFSAGGISVDDGRGYHLLWTLSLQGTLVLGPFEGAEQRFVLRDEWIPQPRRLERDEALGELVRRYLAGRGPTPESDIAWWTKLPLRDVRRGIDVARPELTALEVAGTTLWGHAPTLESVTAETPRATLLLPGFDEYLLGHGNRDPVLDPEHAPLTVPGNNGMFKPTIVHRGRVVGLWSKKPAARRTVLTPMPFGGTLPKAATAGIARAAEDYATYLGTTIDVAVAE